MKSVIIPVMLVVVWAAGGYAAHAQPQLRRLLEKINTLNRPDVCYDYKVQLYDLKSGQVTDSVTGRLYKRGQDYIDSNSIALASVIGKYYCRIDYRQKAVTVYDIDLIRKKLGLEPDKSGGLPTAVPDSLMLKYGRLSVDTGGDAYHYQWKAESQPFPAFSVYIRKGSLKILKVVLITAEEDRDEPGRYRKICTIDNIKNDFPSPVSDPARIYRVSGDKVSLSEKYAGYTLKTLIH